MKGLRLLAILGIIIAIIGAFSVSAEESGAINESISWTLSEDGTVTVSGNGEMGYMYDTPFSGYQGVIKKLVIGEGIKNIGQNFMYGDFTELKELVIADSVERIEDFAFFGCTSLDTIIWGKGLRQIGNSVFYQTALKSVTVPESVERIGSCAFAECTELTEFNIPEGIKYIYGDAVCDTPVDESNFKDGALYIGDILMYTDSEESQFTIKSGTRVIAGCAFDSDRSLESITIPDSVKIIGECAFENCSELTLVNFGNGVEEICESAFEDSAIEQAVFPASLKVIDRNAFYRCESLAEIKFSEGLTFIGREAFKHCAVTEVSIPNSVTSFGYLAFGYNEKLQTATVGDGILYSGGYQFDGCAKLETLSVKDPFAQGENMLRGIANLKNLTIRELESTLADAFQYLKSPALLESLTIGGDLKAVGDNVFSKLTGLKSISLPESVVRIGEDTFKKTAYYKDSANWKNGALYIGKNLIATDGTHTTFTVADGTICIAAGAFRECPKLTTVTIPESVRGIGQHAFAYSSNLSSVNFPDGLVEIGAYALQGTKIYNNADNWKDGKFYFGKYFMDIKSTATDYSIKEGTLCIAEKVYQNVRMSVTSVKIPDSVAYISTDAFNCPNLSEVEFGSGLKYIGETAFINTKLVNVALPESLEYIGEQAFRNCSSLKTVEVLSGVIGDAAFSGATALVSLKLGNKVTKIKNSAFQSCTLLTSVKIPDSVTYLDEWSFYGCSSIKRLEVGSGVKYLRNIIRESGGTVRDMILHAGIEKISGNVIDEKDSAPKNIYFRGTKDAWNKIEFTSTTEIYERYPTIYFGEDAIPPVMTEPAVTGNGKTSPISITVKLDKPEKGGRIIAVLTENGVLTDIVETTPTASVTATFKEKMTGDKVTVFWWDDEDGFRPLSDPISEYLDI